MKNTNLYIQEVQSTPSRLNAKRFTVRHIIIKTFKVKHKENLERPSREVTSPTRDYS